MKFLAIDFEAANYYHDSACAVSLVKVENRKVIKKATFLINPKTKWFHFRSLHGISYNDVKNEPTFKELWPRIRPFFRGIDFVAAHNAVYDKSVLEKCCKRYGIEPPKKPFKCTKNLSKSVWGIKPTRLPDVCAYHKIPLKHHEAASDAIACARIMIKLQKYI